MSVSPNASLEAIGLDDARRAEVDALGEDQIPARVTPRRPWRMASVAHRSASARAPIPFGVDLAVGDFVASGERGPRPRPRTRGAVTRLVGHRRDVVQVVAANVDVVLVVRPLDLSTSPARIQSLLTLAYDSGAMPVVVLTKADLVDDPAETVEAVAAIAPGVEIVVVSVVTGEGVERLRGLVAGTNGRLPR